MIAKVEILKKNKNDLIKTKYFNNFLHSLSKI